MRAGVSIVIPTLNEAENIAGIIARILASTGGLEVEIIVVDDGSRDETQPIVRRLEATLPVKLLARERPEDGLAGAVLAGARAAREEVVLVIDADGSHPPEQIPALALPVIRGERDMVIGSRYMPGGSTPGWSRKRRLMSRAASACAWPLTDVHDALSGFFAVRRELLISIPSDASGFKIALEILVRGGDSIRVAEVPIAFRDRELGQSKMGSGVILTYFRRLLALSGWRESRDTVRLALAKTLLVWGAHWLVFAIAWLQHAGLGWANVIGFAVGAGFNTYLKERQLAPARAQLHDFLIRLVIVSLLSFFLLSGVLATLVLSLGWPPLAASIPAIVTGWAVMFLGYALFIWPDRAQYGAGIRWRVAGLGATAYLFALRLAYLYAMPVDSRLATLPEGWARNLAAPILHSSSSTINLIGSLCWVGAAWFLFQATRDRFDKTAAFRALVLFSILPPYFAQGSVFTPESAPLLVWAALLWLVSGSRFFPITMVLGLASLSEFVLFKPSFISSLLILGAIFLPLLPSVAARMEQPGRPMARWWSPFLFLCILSYGACFYFLAYCP